jgi:hypothetical protein
MLRGWHRCWFTGAIAKSSSARMRSGGAIDGANHQPQQAGFDEPAYHAARTDHPDKKK